MRSGAMTWKTVADRTGFDLARIGCSGTLAETGDDGVSVMSGAAGCLLDSGDGYRTTMANADAALVASRLLERCQDPGKGMPDMATLPCGGVRLEWRLEEMDLEIDVSTEGRIAAWAANADGESALETTIEVAL